MKLREMSLPINDRVAAEQWLKSMHVDKWRRNYNGEIDVDGDVDLRGITIQKLPVKFGVVKGYFSVAGCGLVTLEGCPHTVHGSFHCNQNQITSLEFAPKIIHGSAEFWQCKIESLADVNEHIKFIKTNINFRNNPIKSCGIGLLLINGLVDISWTRNGTMLDKAFSIIDSYMDNDIPKDFVFHCQMELIEAGLEEYAQL